MRPLHVVLIALASSLLVSLAVVAIQSAGGRREVRATAPRPGVDSAAPAGASTGYTPPLNEFMLRAQTQHQKLHAAGSAGNWELALYELDALRTTLTDAGRVHDKWKDLPFRLSSMIPSMMTAAWGASEEAIRARDKGAFGKAFDAISASCNSCHVTANRSFIAIRTPSSVSISNQDFAPSGR